MNQHKQPKKLGTYRNFVIDSTRWDDFKPRDNDIIISTPPKAGTTWTQMICALLVFQTSEFDQRLSDYTPWVDLKTVPIADVLATYEAQNHRRFIKTHTPLDGLPYYENVRYIVVGRDPRDAFFSMDNHRKNTSPEFANLIKKNAGEMASPPQKDSSTTAEVDHRDVNSKTDSMPTDMRDQFCAWIRAETAAETTFDPTSRSVVHHLQSFWEYRHLPNILFMHYADMREDLEREMQRLADYLQIQVPAEVFPKLVKAAQFENMKQNADLLAPNAHKGIWRENARFFNKGGIGQWQDKLGERELKLYAELMQKYDREFLQWLEQGRLAMADV